MVSQMAREDWEALQSKGVSLTFDEIVRLNALGLKVERASRPSVVFAMPRAAFIGDLAFREPTLGHWAWIAQAASAAEMDKEDLRLLAFALSRSICELELIDPIDGKAVNKAVCAFFGRKSPVSHLTRRQLTAALSYAIDGSDHTANEYPPRKSDGEDRETEDEPAAGLIASGLAMRIGSIKDVKSLTASEVMRIAAYQLQTDGKYSADAAHTQAYGDYCKALDTIKEQHKDEMSHGE